MKAKVWITLRVEVDVEGDSDLDCRQAAIDMIDDIEPDQMTAALENAKAVGRIYPHDVTEIVETDDGRDDTYRGKM